MGRGLEVSSSYEFGANGAKAIVLSAFNGTNANVEFTIASNRHRTDIRRIRLGPAEIIDDRWDVGGDSDAWYDLTATVDADATFLRRFAGCLEDV